MFGMKALQARLERIEGSLLWIARELGGEQGLASIQRRLEALSNESAARDAGSAALSDALASQGRALEAQRQQIAQLAETVAAQHRELAQGPVPQGIDKANQALDRIAEVQRPMAQDIVKANQALDRLIEAQGPVAQGVAKASHALDKLFEAVAQIEAAPALREKLELMRVEMEALGEQGLRMVDLLYEAHGEIEELGAKKPKGESPPPE